LNKDQTRDLLATLFAEKITPEFLDGIYRETEGNPFFVEEVCKALVESGDLVHEGGRWHRPEMTALEIPQGIKVTIQSRLGKLSRPEQRLLQMAAMLGREFEYEMLVAVSQQGQDEVIEALEQAEAAQLVEEVRTGSLARGTIFSFTHALIYSTLLSNLSTLRRQRLQRQVALALEEAYPERLGELASLLGRYFAEAGEGEKAVAYLLQAGDDARRVYAYDEAARAYEQALIFLREFGDHQHTARTLMKLGMTYHSMLAFEQSRQAYEEAFVERRRSAESLKAAAAALPDAPHPFRIPTPYDPATLDAAKAADNFSLAMIDLLFSGLVELAADDELLPDVASSWDVLDDGTRYIFHLRDDVTWSDGHPVTAIDFEYAFKRVLSPDDAGRSGAMARTLYDIRGAEAYHSGRVATADAVGVRAVDGLTLEITLEAPSGYFQPTCSPVPRKVVERYGPAWTEPGNIVSNGPFLLQSWDEDRGRVVVRNPGYRGRFGGNVAQIEFLRLGLQEQLVAYGKEEVDCCFPFQESVDEANRAVQQYADDYWTGPGGNCFHLFFDTRVTPFDDRRMRQAMALAIDRDTAVSRAARGFMLPALGGFVPPGIPGHVPGIALPYDPIRAREKAAEAGYYDRDDWPEFELLMISPHGLSGAIETFADQWLEHLGVKVRITAMEFNALLERQTDDPAPLMFIGWAADYPDPDSFLRVASWLRNGRWHNEEYQALVEGARRTLDRRQRLAMYRQAERMLVEEAPVIPLAYPLTTVLIKPWFAPWPTNVNFFIFKDFIMYEH
jgi:oligopeptide transport system substrate-binding protein